MDTNKADFSACCEVTDLHIALFFFFFHFTGVKDFHTAQPDFDASAVWASVLSLLMSAAMILETLLVDVLGMAFCS